MRTLSPKPILFTGKIAFFLFILLSRPAKSATCIALTSGDWGNPLIWSCGAVPGCGDSIVIPALKTVSITTNYNYTGCTPLTNKITVGGTLLFVNGKKLQLPCNSRIYVMLLGSIQASGGGGSNNMIEICGDVYWNADQGNLNGLACIPPSILCSYFLPIELSEFTAENEGGMIRFNWVTASEKNNDRFEIEQSNSASDFVKLGSVKSAAASGNSSSKIEYSYNYEGAARGLTYYRLKQVDLDKTFSYSAIISLDVNMEKDVKLSLYPNPGQGAFTIDVSELKRDGEISLLLTDYYGRIVESQNFELNKSNGLISFQAKNKLVAGVYTCTVMIDQTAHRMKVLVN